MTVTTSSIELFTCPRHAGNLRLLPSACASMWERSQRAERDDPLYLCRGCEIGARHNGLDVSTAKAAAAAAAVATETICIRCGRHPNRLVYRAICVSCWNRCSEWLHGLNRKNKFPTQAKPLHRFTATLAIEGAETRAWAWTENLAQFLAVVIRQHPDGEIKWPSLQHQAFGELSRTDGRALPRPYFLYPTTIGEGVAA